MIARLIAWSPRNLLLFLFLRRFAASAGSTRWFISARCDPDLSDTQ